VTRARSTTGVGIKGVVRCIVASHLPSRQITPRQTPRHRLAAVAQASAGSTKEVKLPRFRGRFAGMDQSFTEPGQLQRSAGPCARRRSGRWSRTCSPGSRRSSRASQRQPDRAGHPLCAEPSRGPDPVPRGWQDRARPQHRRARHQADLPQPEECAVRLRRRWWRALGGRRLSRGDLQAQRRRPATLLRRTADPPRQWLAQQPHRRTHARVLANRRKRLRQAQAAWVRRPRLRCTSAATGASVTIGTKSSATAGARRTWRRQPDTCCAQTCQRRATSATTAPGFNVSDTIRALASSDHCRRSGQGPSAPLHGDTRQPSRHRLRRP
jgi:hypothetical protein